MFDYKLIFFLLFELTFYYLLMIGFILYERTY